MNDKDFRKINVERYVARISGVPLFRPTVLALPVVPAPRSCVPASAYAEPQIERRSINHSELKGAPMHLKLAIRDT